MPGPAPWNPAVIERMNAPAIRAFDAHNHLQSERFGDRRERILDEALSRGVVGMAVNGTCESDWSTVADLARRHPSVTPSFGCHPWRLSRRTDRWIELLEQRLVEFPRAGVGEIGIDRWILESPARGRERWKAALEGGEPVTLPEQEEAFLQQLELAVRLGRPASIHCIQAWGRLLELLKANPLPSRGFLLHSYGGPKEMVEAFADLGAYFGFAGSFAHERKHRQCEVFRSVPLNRLLIETDAPDQMPPESLIEMPLNESADGSALNHPANLIRIYRFAASAFGDKMDHDLCAFSAQMETNYRNLFGSSSGA